MEDPMINCLVPHSLCMRPCMCEYCQQPDTRYVSIANLFGIITCDAHYEWALRDCRAYMHSNKIVLLKDCRNVEDLSTVLEELIKKNNTFHVKRTSGDIETGWSLVEEAYEYPSLQNFDGAWSVYVSNTKVRKFVPLKEFVGHGDLSAELVKKATDILDKGLYLPEYEKQCLLAVETKHITEEPSVGMAVLPDGRRVRVLVPQGHQFHVEDWPPLPPSPP